MNKTWRVTVKVAGNEDFTTIVEAPEQANGWTGKARTRAMFAYPYAINGRFVDYVVEEVKA